MSIVGISVFPLLLMFSSLAAVPLAGPPLPLDPALSAIAPPECLWYATSAGVAEPDPNSTNQTELLFAEPEVQLFATGLQEQLLRTLRQFVDSGRPGQQERVLATELPKLLQALVSRPVAGYVEDFQLIDDGVDIQAGVLLNAGERRAEIEKSLKELTEMALAAGAPIGTINQAGETWSMVRFSMQTPEVRWGWHNDYFILGVGDGTVDTIIERLSGTAPAWLSELRSKHLTQRETTLGYLNVEALLERLQPLLEKQGGWPVVEKLGLTSIKSAHGIAGFDELGCVSMSHLVTDGQRRGLLSLVPYKQLSDNDLKMIPHDAMLAAAVRVDVNETWENFVRLVEEFDPHAAEQMEHGLWEAESELNVNIKDDVLGSLDDVWTAYLPGGDLMTSWLGSAVIVKVKDAERLQEAINKLVAVAMANQPPDGRRGVKIRDTEFAGHTVHTVNVIGEPFPFSPAWCVTDDWLVLGLTPQTVRGVLTRQMDDSRDDQSLADVDAVRQMFSNNVAPAAITYCDTPKLVRSLYPLIQMGVQMLSSQLQREGVEIDTSILPSPDAIIRHLRPGVSTMAYREDGLYFYSQHSLPGGGGTMVMAPMAVGALMPALWSARSAARQAQDLNNMKQIALAFHNYHDANGRFPTNIYDEDGKSLLSWRVQLLPYMEEQHLYEQFNLDEPWDSEHNKPLSEAVVQTFNSPEGPADGATRFLALAGNETLFPGDKKITFAGVRDGLSNTILFVRAAPEAAVPWAKPEDIEFNAEKPFDSLKSPEDRFGAAFADGHCRWLDLKIGEETMRALATRAGREVIDHDALDRN